MIDRICASHWAKLVAVRHSPPPLLVNMVVCVAILLGSLGLLRSVARGQEYRAIEAGVKALERKDYMVAERAFQSAVTQDPRSALALKLLGVTFGAQKKSEPVAHFGLGRDRTVNCSKYNGPQARNRRLKISRSTAICSSKNVPEEGNSPNSTTKLPL
jgi:hypothetical protein